MVWWKVWGDLPPSHCVTNTTSITLNYCLSTYMKLLWGNANPLNVCHSHYVGCSIQDLVFKKLMEKIHRINIIHIINNKRIYLIPFTIIYIFLYLLYCTVPVKIYFLMQGNRKVCPNFCIPLDEDNSQKKVI